MDWAGFLKLHRKIIKNPIIKKDKLFRVWIVLLCLANYKAHIYKINGEKIALKPGQLITSRYKLAQITGIDDATIDRLLHELINEPSITQVCKRKYRIITILKWKHYQFIHKIPSQ